MKQIFALIIVALGIAACGSQPPQPATGIQPAQPGTGIQGTVQVGPTCPVERINSPCPPHPLAATIVVRDGNGIEVARFYSGIDGQFKVDLRPGTYNLVGLTTGSSFLPRPIPTSATVSQGTYTPVNVEYDSGIR